MALVWVDRKHLDSVWPVVSGLLAKAVSKNNGEATLDQIRAQVTYGAAQLLIWYDEGCKGAAVVEFTQHPQLRVAHVSYTAGKDILTSEVFEEVKQWCREQGASQVRALCGEAESRLLSRVGYKEIYRMMKVDL